MTMDECWSDIEFIKNNPYIIYHISFAIFKQFKEIEYLHFL